jgi:nucleoside-diphosphate-sugar epimerase
LDDADGGRAVKVLVTGATGYIGAHTAATLEAAGHDLRLLVRDREKAARIGTATGFRADDVIVGDVTDSTAVDKALVGCDAVIHTAAAVAIQRGRASEMLHVNTTGTSNVIGHAAERDLDAIVYVSSTSSLAERTGQVLTVDSPCATGDGYTASKAGAEAIARDLQRQGAPVRITYPSGVIGPAAGEALGETSTSMARFVASGVLPTPRASLSIIDVRDVAEIHRRLLEPDAPRRIMCGGTRLSMYELRAVLSEVTGRRFPMLPIPPNLLRLSGRVLDRLTARLPVEFPVTEESMTIITTWAGTDDNAPSALGMDYRPIASTFACAVGAWYDAGLLSRRQAGRLARGGPK